MFTVPYHTLQRQTAVTADLTSTKLLLFAVTRNAAARRIVWLPQVAVVDPSHMVFTVFTYIQDCPFYGFIRIPGICSFFVINISVMTSILRMFYKKYFYIFVNRVFSSVTNRLVAISPGPLLIRI